MVRLSGDASKLLAELAKGEAATGRFQKQSSASLMQWKTAAVAAGAAAGAGIAAGLGMMIKSGVSAASDLNESMNAVNKIFGESAGVIHAWGEENATAFGLSQRAFNQMATPLGAMLKNADLDMKTVARTTISLTERAADMASVFNFEVTDALAAIQAGLRGESDPLEKFGVTLSAAKVEAQALADTGKALASELTDQEKALARINIIMRETAHTAGDMKDTENGLANAKKILNSQIEEMQTKLGQKLLPYIEEAVVAMKDWVKTNGDQFVEDLGDFIIEAADATRSLVAFTGDVLSFAKALGDAALNADALATNLTRATVGKLPGADEDKTMGPIEFFGSGILAPFRALGAAGDVIKQIAEGPLFDFSPSQATLDFYRTNPEYFNDFQAGAVEQHLDGLENAARVAAVASAESIAAGIDKFTTLDRALVSAATAAAGAGGGGGGGAAGAARELTAAEKALAAARADLFDTISGIQNRFLQEQVQAYLRGGAAQVEAVKGQQQEMLAAARTIALDLMQTFSIDLPTALNMAMDHLRGGADALARHAKEAREELLQTLAVASAAAREQFGGDPGAFAFKLDETVLGAGYGRALSAVAGSLTDAFSLAQRELGRGLTSAEQAALVGQYEARLMSPGALSAPPSQGLFGETGQPVFVVKVGEREFTDITVESVRTAQAQGRL